jgi:choline-sulfatase
MPSKPLNVIILTSDEMRGDIPGFMGNPDVKTPNLDRLASKGVVFTRHFTVHGKCVPSRIAMQNGRYSHTDGYRTITQHMPEDQPNLLGLLKKRGYESAVFGHNHVWETLFPGEEQGKEKSAGYADYHSFVKPFHDLAKKERPVPPPAPNSPKPVELPDGDQLRSTRIEGKRGGFIDINRAEQAVRYLSQVRDRSKPFYLHVNMSSPHPPYQVEEPFYSMYDREGIRHYPGQLPENAPLPLRRMREIRTGLNVDPRVLKEMQCVYYGMCTRVDRDLGMVLDCIEREGLFENSVVLFTTDHGDFAGQYGLTEKWDTAMNDCIMHVPFILKAPGLPEGLRVNALTEHVDIPSTVLALLGEKPDWGVHGESMLPVLRGEKRKEAVFADGGHEEEMWARFLQGRSPEEQDKGPANGKQRTYYQYPETMSRTKMVRTEKWKLVIRLTGGNEIYDMENDPDELSNLWGVHERDARLKEVVMDLQTRLIDWCLRTDTDRPWQEKVGA